MKRPTRDDDRDDSADDHDARNERDDHDDRERDATRRGLLSSGAALATSLAAAGCLSNPWSPGATRREPTARGSENATVATETDASGGDATTAGGDDTATDGDGTTGDGGTDTATTTEATTEVPAAEQDPDLVVEVAPDGFMFSPESFEIAAGDTVHWEWKDSGHNVRVKSKPDGSDWTGTPGGATDTYGEGYLHAHTFEESGQYEYYCAPHRSLGLRGSFDVS